MDYSNIIAVLIAAAALVVSILSWQASVRGVRASTYDQRYAIYSDAEKFLGGWIRDARPDMSLLPLLVGAWSRSHFLCSGGVTAYLRELWLDSVRADHLRQIMSREAQGDHGQAVDEFHQLLRRHTDFDRLRAAFLPDLKV